MNFKLCTIAILIGICVFISNAKEKKKKSDDSDDGKVCDLKLFETQNTYGKSSESDCEDCLIYCTKGNKKSCITLYCTTHDSGWTPTPKPVTTSVTTAPTDEGNPSEQKKPKDCPALDCPPKDCTTLREISGVSVGAALGILVLGLFFGAVATAALCVCCPSVHAKASAVRTGKKKTCSDENLEDDEISKSRPLPLAPLPSLPADIRATATTAQNANSGRPASQHIYSESMDLPVGSTNTYNAYGYDHANTNSSLAPVTSPTYGYNKLTNDVIPSTSSSKIVGGAYQTLNADRSQNAGYNQIPAVKDDGDLRSQEHNDPGGAHQYFVLEKKDAEMDSTETCHRDNDTSVPHDYFVLEKK
ncbi:uncharacterized protein LOC128217939 isoform X2 [Mya arenaria]|uniref:uncharacterized protein LOC128217939 isoform X2 n=1 Tax=Mya arenaria TaxID=6604 RepID=UPI0022DFA7EF|nr:uncharacterized protein LOC128217939 isoform X2 [Mya arenaria]